MRFAVFLALACVLPASRGQNEGQPCVHHESKRSGTCTLLDHCPTALATIEHRKRPQNCFFRPGSKKAIVCCVPPDPERISMRMCKEYSNRVLGAVNVRNSQECVMPTDTKVNTQIVGGTPARLKEFPHMALLGFGTRENHQYKCGGSLISPTFVLTAAHCLSNSRHFVQWVRLGELDIRNDTDGAQPQLAEVVERIAHPAYNWSLKYDDIALLRLKEPVEINGFVRPACVHNAYDVNIGSATAAGWGLTEDTGDASDILLKVDIELQSLVQCKEHYNLLSDRRTVPKGIIETQLCAGGTYNKDTCQGDSGGPLMFRSLEDCMYYVIGLTSFGRVCGSLTPAVYTRIAAYVSWIEQIVWPSEISQRSGTLVDRGESKLTPCEEFKNSNFSDTGSVSKTKCREYSNYVCHSEASPLLMPNANPIERDRCYANLPLVSGGQAVPSAMAFPHMALLGYDAENGTIKYGCGGTLVSPNFILTAAHCKEVSWALTGAIFRNDTPTQHHPQSGPQLIKVKQTTVHPSYQDGEGYADIQLLQLEKAVEITDYVRPACLSDQTDSQGVATAAGWGFTDDDAEHFTDQLMTVNLKTKSLNSCKQVIERKWVTKGLDNTHLCVGGDGIRDTCKGDSGGPLFVRKPDTDTYCMYTIVGVVSFGPICGRGDPAVYVNVAPFVPWIESIVWPQS